MPVAALEADEGPYRLRRSEDAAWPPKARAYGGEVENLWERVSGPALVVARLLLPVLLLGLLLASLAHLWVALALVAGVAIGAALGRHGLQLTTFESTPQGLFYTPSTHLGLALSLLLIVRLGWRAVQIYTSGVPVDAPPADFARSPLTLLIVGSLAGYHLMYAIGLLR